MVFRIPAVRAANEAVDKTPDRDGDGRRAASLDRRDGLEGPRATATIKETASMVGQTWDEKHARGVPVGVIGAVAVAALVLGLALGGGGAYLCWRLLAFPPVVILPPTQQAPAQNGLALDTQPDAPLVAHGHDPDRTTDGHAPPQRPDPTPLARLQDLKGMPDAEASQKQPELRLARAEASVQADVPPAGQAAQKQRWEYLVVTLPADNNQATEQMNRLAGEGWEYLGLISTSIPGTSGVFEPHANQVVGARGGHESSILLRRVKVPYKVGGAIEGENMKIAAKSADFDIHIQDMMDFSLGKWSADRQLFARPLQAGAWADLKLPAPAQARYRITVYLCRSWDYGVIQFLVNGTKIGKPIDGFRADSVDSTGAIDLGAADLKEGVNTLRVEVVDTNPRSVAPHYSWGLDCVVLKQVN
jgi:hypothetical protein